MIRIAQVLQTPMELGHVILAGVLRRKKRVMFGRYVCAFVCVLHIYTYIHTYIYIDRLLCVCVCVYIYIYTHTHIDMMCIRLYAYGIRTRVFDVIVA